MINTARMITIAGLICAGAVQAHAGSGKWSHASAPMGQYEGGYESPDGNLTINYSCALERSLGFRVKTGMQDIELAVDGRTVFFGTPSLDGEEIELWTHEPLQATIGNSLMKSLIHGKELKVLGAGGAELATVPLDDASDMEVCVK